MTKKYRTHDGQVIIEFAFMLPLLALIIAGIAEFGVLFYNKQLLTNASREGARAGIVYLLDDDGNKIVPDIDKVVQDYCKNRLLTFGGSSLPTTTTTPAVAGLSYPSDLKVTVSYQYTFLIPSMLNWFGGSFGPNLNIAGVTVMKME
jgi:Flp pilus assembly protein TadG